MAAGSWNLLGFFALSISSVVDVSGDTGYITYQRGTSFFSFTDTDYKQPRLSSSRTWTVWTSINAWQNVSLSLSLSRSVSLSLFTSVHPGSIFLFTLSQQRKLCDLLAILEIGNLQRSLSLARRFLWFARNNFWRNSGQFQPKSWILCCSLGVIPWKYIHHEMLTFEGNMSLILTAPHGGTLQPDFIASRGFGCWNPAEQRCVFLHDCERVRLEEDSRRWRKHWPQPKSLIPVAESFSGGGGG